MITTSFYTKIMKGDNVEWKFCKVTLYDGEIVLFECFPYRNEYMVLGIPISVFDLRPKDKWGVEHRKWNSQSRKDWQEFISRDDAFIYAAIKVRNYRIKLKENNNKHPE